MGTSVSHPSPKLPNWRATAAAYVSSAVPIERLVAEVWGATLSQDDGGVATLLAEPVVGRCANIASTVHDKVPAAIAAAKEASASASFGADLARRAVVLSAGEAAPARTYVAALFAEATDYLISRDASGYVGLGNRLKTVGDLIELKRRARDVVAKVTAEHDLPADTSRAQSWAKFVRAIATALGSGR